MILINLKQVENKTDEKFNKTFPVFSWTDFFVNVDFLYFLFHDHFLVLIYVVNQGILRRSDGINVKE